MWILPTRRIMMRNMAAEGRDDLGQERGGASVQSRRKLDIREICNDKWLLECKDCVVGGGRGRGCDLGSFYKVQARQGEGRGSDGVEDTETYDVEKPDAGSGV